MPGSACEMREGADNVRRASRLLSGYLCGTHSGLPARGSAGRLGAGRVEDVAAAHRRTASVDPEGPARQLGAEPWQPEKVESELARALRRSLAHDAVVDLVFYGSQARGNRTGFSDVDAILVIADAAANDPGELRLLRQHVLAALRAVVAYQPMQHHGFEVVTPKLLRAGSQALALPSAALEKTCSLNGVGATAWLTDGLADGTSSLCGLVDRLTSFDAWPAHPWPAHGLVSMLELLPTLYLQSSGASVPKWRSFEEARPDFEEGWWAYDELRNIRSAWPRLRMRRVEQACFLTRNPWVALAAWRRLPEPLPKSIRPLLTQDLFEGLQTLAVRMRERAA